MAKRKWTVIMYLNGNNELGIEMEDTFKEACKVKNNDINTILYYNGQIRLRTPLNLFSAL